MKLLCAADLHLGRRPTRLPDEIGDTPGLESDLSPQAAWRRLVDVAVAERVTAVLLAGDLLDDEHDYFETFGDLRAGVERLIDAGIGVLAVSGNHDVGVLPRLASAVPGLRVLGLGGVWEVATLTDDDVTVHVAGWSYPQPVVDSSPVPLLAAALDEMPPGAVISLLHCDRDQTGSRYAPVTSLELDSAPVDAWLLGHVHKPDFGRGRATGRASRARYAGYLGAISPADPGEEGVYGAWLIEVERSTDESITVRRLPLAALRYETVTLDVSALTTAEELGVAMTSAVTDLAGELGATSTDLPLRAVGVRLRLVGRSPIRAELSAALATDDPRKLVLRLGARSGGLLAFVHDHRFEVTPTHDLAAMAAGHDPLALLARKLLLLGADGDSAAGDDPAVESEPGAERAPDRASDRAALLASAREDLGAIAAGRHYTSLPHAQLGDDVLAGLLRHAALDLLDAMLASRDEA